MPDNKETGREPTEHERKTEFAPHQSPARQADGDPGVKKPPPDPQSSPATGTESESETETETGDENTGDPATNDVAGDRGKWTK